MAQPRFIVLEGIDGSGTTAQSLALTSWLERRGHTVVRTHEPSNGAIGRLIRDRLRSEADPLDRRALALLFAADRLHHLQTVIAPALEAGTLVVCDRYLMSSWAYQALDCELSWVRTINGNAVWPDLTVFIDVPVEVALARVKRRDGIDPKEIFETQELQRRVSSVYHALLDEGLKDVHRVDGSGSLSEVTDLLTAHCRDHGL